MPGSISVWSPCQALGSRELTVRPHVRTRAAEMTGGRFVDAVRGHEDSLS